MCCSFLIDKNDPAMQAIENHLALSGLKEQIKNGEVSPADTALVLEWVHGKIRALPMSWGFPRWQTRSALLPATPAETIHKEALLRNCLLSRPVVVPTSGFFTRSPASGAENERHLFREHGETMLYLAGFAGTFPFHNGKSPDLFVLLTTPANEPVAPYSERMPVLVRHDEIEAWIAGDDLALFLERKPFAVEATRIAP